MKLYGNEDYYRSKMSEKNTTFNMACKGRSVLFCASSDGPKKSGFLTAISAKTETFVRGS